MSNIVTGIDIGSYQVKVVIAERADDPRQLPHILGTGYAESRGLKHGYVISVPDVARSVAAAVAQASKAAGHKVERACIGIGGIGLDEAFSHGEAAVERGDSEITERDVARAIAASEKAVPPAAITNKKILHTIPLSFSVDGARILGKNPAGMKGSRVSVDTFLITCLDRHVADILSAVDEAGIEVEDIAASPMAASFVSLSKMQKRVGCILANIGSETMSTIVYEDTIPVSIKVFPVGGNDITNDLALGMRIALEEAEQLKHGAVLGAPYPKRKIDDLISKRLTDMFKLIDAHLKSINKDELLPAGIVMTGGSSVIPLSADLAKSILRLPSRAATLTDGSSDPSLPHDSSWSVAYGLTIWGDSQRGATEPFGGNGVKDMVTDAAGNIWRWFKKFLP